MHRHDPTRLDETECHSLTFSNRPPTGSGMRAANVDDLQCPWRTVMVWCLVLTFSIEECCVSTKCWNAAT